MILALLLPIAAYLLAGWVFRRRVVRVPMREVYLYEQPERFIVHCGSCGADTDFGSRPMEPSCPVCGGTAGWPPTWIDHAVRGKEPRA